jgi:predicted aldo/keto reductase-like oxidoreductase
VLYRRFGKTELNLSVLSLGMMRIMPLDGESHADNLARTEAVMRTALDAGINHVETARGYGPSEALIGEVLRNGRVKREEFILTTKVAPSFSAAEFRANLEDSMARMGVDVVDNLDIHGINTPEHIEMVTSANGCMQAVREMTVEGKVRHIGFSTHAPLEVILDALNTDLFESINLHYYYINQRNRPAVELATAKDMGVFIISPTDKGGQLFNPPQRFTDLCAPLTPIEMNQRWLLSQPEVHTLSLGLTHPEELLPHLPMADNGNPLTPEERAVIARLDAQMSALGDSLCTFCHACLPCPEDVHIPEILRLRNLVHAYDMTEFGKYRYKMFTYKDENGVRAGGAGHWFPGSQGNFCTDCGDCLPRCPQNLPIPQLLAETHARLHGEVGKRISSD